MNRSCGTAKIFRNPGLCLSVLLFSTLMVSPVRAANYELITPNFNHIFYPGLSTYSDNIRVLFTTPSVNWFQGPGWYSPTLVSSVPIYEYRYTPLDNTLRMQSGGMNFYTASNNNGLAAWIGAVDQLGAPTQYSFSLTRSYMIFPAYSYSEPVELSVASSMHFAMAQSGSGYYGGYYSGASWPSFKLLTFYNGNFIDGLTGWNVASPQGSNGYPSLVSYHGVPAAKFGNSYDYPGSLGQTLYTTPGQYYEVSFWLASTGGSRFSGQVDGTTFFDSLVNTDIDLSTEYATITHTFQASSTSTDLLFSGQASGSFYLGNVTLTAVAPPPVPEPASLILLGSGLGIIVFVVRRRRHSAP